MVWANQDFFSAHRVPLVPDARRLPGSGLLKKTNSKTRQMKIQLQRLRQIIRGEDAKVASRLM